MTIIILKYYELKCIIIKNETTLKMNETIVRS